MKLVNLEIIDEFAQKHRNAAGAIISWKKEAEKAQWKTTQDIKQSYSSASFLEKNHVIFNIKGNNYRLVVQIAFNTGYVSIKWAGTHAEYDKKTFP